MMRRLLDSNENPVEVMRAGARDIESLSPARRLVFDELTSARPQLFQAFVMEAAGAAVASNKSSSKRSSPATPGRRTSLVGLRRWDNFPPNSCAWE